MYNVGPIPSSPLCPLPVLGILSQIQLRSVEERWEGTVSVTSWAENQAPRDRAAAEVFEPTHEVRVWHTVSYRLILLPDVIKNNVDESIGNKQPACRNVQVAARGCLPPR